jgi:hypothetical protein
MYFILCSGMMRSGSTWSFNVCRLIAHLLAKQFDLPFINYRYLAGNLLDNMLKQDKLGLALAKTHNPTKFAFECLMHRTVKIICTIRDPRDCVASLQLFYNDANFAESVFIIKNNLLILDSWRFVDRILFIRYEDMFQNPSSQIRKIADYLDFSLNDKLVEDIDNQTSMKSIKQFSEGLRHMPAESLVHDARTNLADPITQIHENHIHGGLCGRWKDELTLQQKEIVMNEFKPWLLNFEYETESSVQNILSSLIT